MEGALCLPSPGALVLRGKRKKSSGERVRGRSYIPREIAQAIFQWSRDGILLCDERGTVQQANAAAGELFQWEPKEVVGKVAIWDLFVAPWELEKVRSSRRHRGEVTEFEAQLMRSKGEIFDARITLLGLGDRDGNWKGHLVIVRDVSVERKAREELEAKSLHLATLTDVARALASGLELREVLDHAVIAIHRLLRAASIRIYMLDPTGQWLELAAWKGASEAFIHKEHFQRRRVGDGLLGKTALARKATVVDNFLRAEDPYVEDIVKEGLVSSVYIPLVSKEKAVGVLCVSSYQEYRFSEEFIEFLTAVGNQIGVAIENARLYERLKEAYEEISQTQEQLIRTEKMASLGKLAATVAHEINNPLSVVLTYIKLMQNMLRKGTFGPKRLSDISRFLATMESETSRCGEIVRNLLAFARHSTLKMEEHRVEEIIQRTVALMAHDLEMKEMKLVCSCEPNLPMVKCDFRQIQQALLNLMINATEAMTKGGILTVTAGRSSKEGFVRLSISDTGCGIAEENLSQIFEPFFTTKEEAKGVGLGLTVVQGIIARHGGTIEVESQVGKGTTFHINLPAIEEQGTRGEELPKAEVGP